MNLSFVTLVYIEHSSPLDIIIILGTALQLESMIEEISFIRICDTPRSSGGRTNIWNRNLTRRHTDQCCRFISVPFSQIVWTTLVRQL